jgi:hypothetical protein
MHCKCIYFFYVTCACNVSVTVTQDICVMIVVLYKLVGGSIDGWSRSSSLVGCSSHRYTDVLSRRGIFLQAVLVIMRLCWKFIRLELKTACIKGSVQTVIVRKPPV